MREENIPFIYCYLTIFYFPDLLYQVNSKLNQVEILFCMEPCPIFPFLISGVFHPNKVCYREDNGNAFQPELPPPHTLPLLILKKISLGFCKLFE